MSELIKFILWEAMIGVICCSITTILYTRNIIILQRKQADINERLLYLESSIQQTDSSCVWCMKEINELKYDVWNMKRNKTAAYGF